MDQIITFQTFSIFIQTVDVLHADEMLVELFFFIIFHNDVLCCSVPSGRIRNKAEVDDGAADAVLSLNIISAKNIKSSHNTNRYSNGTLRVTLVLMDSTGNTG